MAGMSFFFLYIYKAGMYFYSGCYCVLSISILLAFEIFYEKLYNCGCTFAFDSFFFKVIDPIVTVFLILKFPFIVLVSKYLGVQISAHGG